MESYEELFSISKKEINFEQCLPGTIHEMKFTISLKKELIKPIEFSMFFYARMKCYMSHLLQFSPSKETNKSISRNLLTKE